MGPSCEHGGLPAVNREMDKWRKPSKVRIILKTIIAIIETVIIIIIAIKIIILKTIIATVMISLLSSRSKQ